MQTYSPRCFNRVALFTTANDPLKQIDVVNGIKIGVEWRKGEVREYDDGYKQKMKADYGYIRGTDGEDGEETDVYVGPNTESALAFRVTQLDKKTGAFDEYKWLVGYDSEEEAAASYKSHMEPEHFGGIKEYSWDEFAKQVPRSQRV